MSRSWSPHSLDSPSWLSEGRDYGIMDPIRPGVFSSRLYCCPHAVDIHGHCGAMPTSLICTVKTKGNRVQCRCHWSCQYRLLRFHDFLRAGPCESFLAVFWPSTSSFYRYLWVKAILLKRLSWRQWWGLYSVLYMSSLLIKRLSIHHSGKLLRF